MIDEEPTTGFDRRSLIKKGLVGAGIAATVPVISTFNTAAFASSVPGCHLVQFNIAANGSLTGPFTPTAAPAGCNPTDSRCTGTIQTGTVNTFIGGAPGPGANQYTFALQGGWTSCEIVAASVQNDNGNNCNSTNVGPVFSGLNSNSVTYTKTLNGNVVVRLLVLC